MATKEVSHYKSVATLTTDANEWVVPSGEVWFVEHFEGNAAFVEDTEVCLVWDYGGTEEIIRATHGDAVWTPGYAFTGNGTKKLAIVLDNQSANSQSMGGSYVCKQVS